MLDEKNNTKNQPRNDRVFHNKNGWYFATREGLDLGPYPTRESAENEVEFYLKSITKLSRAS